jgi:hypothetical protein
LITSGGANLPSGLTYLSIDHRRQVFLPLTSRNGAAKKNRKK